MHRLKSITSLDDIPSEHRGTPVGKLLEYQNLKRPFDQYTNAAMLIGMCMDNRKQLNMPQNFAYIIRDGGASLKNKYFKVSFAISIGGIRHIALIGHSQCGMVGLESRKADFIKGLVSNGGWSAQAAEDYFDQEAPIYEIGNAIDFVFRGVERLRMTFPLVTVVPMYYKVENDLLYIIEE